MKRYKKFDWIKRNQEGHIWTPRINQHYIVFFNRLNGFLGRR